MSFVSVNTQDVWDRLELMNLATVQPEESPQERAKKAKRMRRLFNRSQIGQTILMSGASIDDEPVNLGPQQAQILAASRSGLTILTESKQELQLDYRTIRLPLPRGIIESEVESQTTKS